MTCPLCGKAYPCIHSSNHSSVLLDSELPELSAKKTARSAEPSPEVGATPEVWADQLDVNHYWRQEVVSRLRMHRSRRRKGDDSQSSLDLDFNGGDPATGLPALDEPPSEPHVEQVYRPVISQPAEARVVKQEPPKIIRFPHRNRTPVPYTPAPDANLNELAEPVVETPRILDAPEVASEARQMELLPSFDDIALEPEATVRSEQLGKEIFPQPAPLHLRIFSGMVDAGVVMCGAAAFAIVFLVFANGVPSPRLVLAAGAMTAGMLWLVLQYLFLCFGHGTPGMRMTDLRVCTLSGERAELRGRRIRALASALSFFAAGLGYAWTLVDEDSLGWHDRISGTYVGSN